MRAMLRAVGETAISRTVQTVSETAPQQPAPETTVQMDSESSDWFANSAQSLLGKDAGFQLALVTNGEERTCYRYAAGTRMPSADFFRNLLRSPQGWQWLAAAMDGCTEQWWLDAQRARHIKQALDAIK